MEAGWWVPKVMQDVVLTQSGEAEVLVVTSGWHYKHWKGNFYPSTIQPKDMLSRYARKFSTVELNNTFYRLPDEITFRKWKEQVTPDFIFAIKASRFITHIKRLREPKASIDLLLQRAAPLGKSLGPLLFQLPPGWKLNLERLRGFLEALPKPLQVVVEFRDPSWCVEEVYRMLQSQNVALCIHDWQNMPWPQVLTADFTYVRLHGHKQRYGGDYPESELRKWASRIESWKRRLKQVYVYFNNDVGGYAVMNAQLLKQFLAGRDNELRQTRAA